MKHTTLFILALVSVLVLRAQPYDNIAFDNRTYVDGLTSVSLTPVSVPLGYPLITLGSGEQLCLNYDDLEGNDNRYLKYTVIHCTHDWKPSDLNPFDYIEGFTEDEFTDHSYSFNTVQSYVHFTLRFPNDMLKITKSGNYLLFVYDDTPDNPVLTRRFMVKEPEDAIITGEVHAASDTRYRFTGQEVDFTVNTGSLSVYP